MTLSGRRGYLWASIALTAALVVVILWPTPKPEQKEPPSADTIESQQRPEDSIRLHTNYNAKRYHSTDHKPQAETDWSILYDHKSEHRSSYDNFKVEINSADTTDLKELRGIGSTFARRIVKYRDLLGGYHSCEQIKEVYGMTDTLYSLISNHLTVDADGLRQINLNDITLDQLKRHPYIDYYQAKAIVKYREQHGPFSSVEELLNLAVIDQDTYNRIKNYLTL